MKNKLMKRRLWSMLVAAGMCVSVLPMAVFAADNEISDEQGLIEAVANGGSATYTLTDNISLTDTLSIEKDFVLNMNGFSIEWDMNSQYYGGAETLIAINDASVTFSGGDISYIGTGTAIEINESEGATATVIFEGGSFQTECYFNQDSTIVAEALFAVTGNPEIVLKKGTFGCALDWGNPDGEDGVIISDEKYVTIPDTSFIEKYSDVSWEVTAFSDGDMSDAFKSILNANGELEVNRYKPFTAFEAGPMCEALGSIYGPEDSLTGEPNDREYYFRFRYNTYDAESSTICADLIEPSEYGMYDILETRRVKLSFVYNSDIKDEVDALISSLLKGEDMGGGVFAPYVYRIDDMELINYWLNYSDESSMIHFSGEFQEDIGHKNFYMDVRAGGGGAFEDSANGYGTFTYNGVVYASVEMEAASDSILYVPEGTVDLMAAAQARLDEYLGTGKVTLKETTVREAVIRTDYQIFGAEDETFEEFKANYDPAPMGEYEIGVAGLVETDICYETVINGVYRYLLIKTGSADKMKTPTYQNVDVGTTVTVTSDESAIPLDTMLKVEELTSGAQYEEIMSVLDVENNVTYDIKLHSASKNDYVTKLNSGKFQVKLPVPTDLEGKTLVVYYVTGDDKIEEHTVTVADGYAIFETDHFSIYTLAEKAGSEAVDPPAGNTYFVWVSMALLISCAAIGTVVLYRKNNFLKNFLKKG